MQTKVYYSGQASQSVDQLHANEVMRKEQDRLEAQNKLIEEEQHERMEMEVAKQEGADKLIGNVPFCVGSIKDIRIDRGADPLISAAYSRSDSVITFLKVHFDERGHASSITVLKGVNKSVDDNVIQTARQWTFQVIDSRSKTAECIQEIKLRPE